MSSRPRKRKRPVSAAAGSEQQAATGSQEQTEAQTTEQQFNGTMAVEVARQIGESMKAAIPTITASVLQALRAETTAAHPPIPQQPILSRETEELQEETPPPLPPRKRQEQLVQPTFEALTRPGMSLPKSETISRGKPIGMGVDPKIKAKIVANEYIELATLCSKTETKDKYHSEIHNNELVFVKTNNQVKIDTMTKWADTFHTFVGIYCKQHTDAAVDLMQYMRIVQSVANDSSDAAAIEYDKEFRKWREEDPKGCGNWNQKNTELYTEALASGLNSKLRAAKQPFRPTPAQAGRNYCFQYNNTDGKCPRQNCPYPHVCSRCLGPHFKRHCTKPGPSETPRPTGRYTTHTQFKTVTRPNYHNQRPQ